MPENDTRFQLGFTAIAVMAGISLIIHWLSKGDLILSSGIFFIGLGVIYLALSYRKPASTYLLPFGGFLAAVGGIILFLKYPGDIRPVIGAVLVIGGTMLMIRIHSKRES